MKKIITILCCCFVLNMQAGNQDKYFEIAKNMELFTQLYKELNTYYVDDIDPNKLWLMEEGHCFRSQIVNLCELRRSSELSSHFEYEAGSIETLRRMVEMNDGITILPELTTLDMTARQMQLIRHFKKPAPMREVSIVVHRDFVKKRLIEALREEIIAAVPERIKKNRSSNVVPV